ncbi:MAG: hypothetical protein ACLQVY_09185 [Limisphaerales bacterium]
MREAEIPAVVDLRSFVVLLFVLYIGTNALIKTLGNVSGYATVALLIAFIASFLWNVLKLGLTRVDSILIQLPVIGPVYEAWFRRDTYFQQDTRMAFLHSVMELVKRSVEETTSAQGIKFLDYFEHQPLMDGIYTRSRVQLGSTVKIPAMAA